MHVEQGIELSLDRLFDRSPAGCEAGVVDDDVDAVERGHRGAHHRPATVDRRDIVIVRDRRATLRRDLGDDGVGRAAVGAAPVEIGAEIVDEHRRADVGEGSCVCAAQTSPAAGHHRHPAVEGLRILGRAHGRRTWRPRFQAAGGSLTCGNSSSNEPRVIRSRTSGSTSSNSSWSVFWVWPNVPSRCG